MFFKTVVLYLNILTNIIVLRPFAREIYSLIFKTYKQYQNITFFLTQCELHKKYFPIYLLLMENMGFIKLFPNEENQRYLVLFLYENF